MRKTKNFDVSPHIKFSLFDVIRRFNRRKRQQLFYFPKSECREQLGFKTHDKEQFNPTKIETCMTPFLRKSSSNSNFVFANENPGLTLQGAMMS